MSHRVLVAEDDASVRMTLEFVLADEGFEVFLAADGAQALELARSCDPDVILLDQIMPVMDGKQVLEALRADGSIRDVPVLVLTGMERESADDWLGAHFVGKPFSPDALVERIRSLLA